ncbi:MAG: hypothetical protein K2O02_07885 [Lachnospiraceae bacterium]|nr:hypothetical protein [Lachnospiraceae bacterium]
MNSESKTGKYGYLLLALFVLVLGIAAVMVSGSETIGYMKGPADISSMSGSELEDVVYGEIELSKAFLYGCYDISYNTENGIKTPETYSYILYIGDYVSGNAKFIGIEVNEDKIEDMDRIVDESWEAINAGKPLEEYSELKIKGKLKKMSDDGYTSLANELTKMGIDSSTIQKNTLRLVLDENGTTDNNMFILFGAGVILILTGIIWSICIILIKHKKKI